MTMNESSVEINLSDPITRIRDRRFPSLGDKHRPIKIATTAQFAREDKSSSTVKKTCLMQSSFQLKASPNQRRIASGNFSGYAVDEQGPGVGNCVFSVWSE